MSYINAEMYDALIAAGSPEDKAKAAAGSIPAGEHLATKEDLAGVKAEIANLRAELHRTALISVGVILGGLALAVTILTVILS